MFTPALLFYILYIFMMTPTMVYGAAANQPLPSAGITAMSAPEKLHDIKDVIPLPSPFPWWYWLAAISALICIIVLVVLLLKKKKTNNQDPLLPHERALKALDAAQALITPGQSRAFAVKVADILRTYIEERFRIFQPNLTTREFLYQLTRHQADNDILLAHNTLLHDWLNHCDMVKFAQYTLSRAEMEQMVAQVRQFIGATTEGAATKSGSRTT